MFKRLLAPLIFCVALTGCVTQREWFPPDAEAGRQIARWVTAPTEENPRAGFQCWVYLPKYYSSDDVQTSYPLLVFLHGSGESGTDLEKVRRYGGPPKILTTPDAKPDWPFITVSPQSPAGFWKPHELLALIGQLEKEYRVDSKRIYITGLSMGGIGTWYLALHAPERFAAIAPICGWGEPKEAAKLVNLPVWAFHGDKDKNVPVQRSIDMVEAIVNAGGTKAQLMIFEGAEHDVWTRTYAHPALYKWLLSNKLK